MTIRKETREQINAAIAAGAIPRAPRSGIGLVLPNGRRRTVLMNQAGQLTAAGTRYYEQTDQTPPSSFDFAQEPERAGKAGRSLVIKMLDGSRKAVSTFDSVAKQFKPTALGKKFYANRKDKFTILFPVSIDLTRTNGRRSGTARGQRRAPRGGPAGRGQAAGSRLDPAATPGLGRTHPACRLRNESPGSDSANAVQQTEL